MNLMSSGPLSLVVIGHVDHGKSTLIGRLLHDTGSLPQAKKEEIEKASLRRGEAVEWSYLLDSFQAERDQAVTIDTTQIRFVTGKRAYTIIDAPGHKEFLKNMLSGAARADAAILVVDAVEGWRAQTESHAGLLPLLGIRPLIVVVNKMDRISFAQDQFAALEKYSLDCLATLGLAPSAVIPVCAREGAMIAERGLAMPWYKGQTLLEALEALPAAPERFDAAAPLRFPVQDVYRIGDKRVIAGRITGGSIRVNDPVLISPANTLARITSIQQWPESDIPLTRAVAGQSVGITLDRPAFVERGHSISHEQEAPCLTASFGLDIFWLDASPPQEGKTYTVRFGTAGATAILQKYDAPRAVFKSSALLCLDPGDPVAVYDKSGLAGCGRVNPDGLIDQRPALRGHDDNLFPVDHFLDCEARSLRNGHKGGVFWLTGLSASGKSTIAMAAEHILFNKGCQAYVLDGDAVRRGLNADLGFSDRDRSENIRRIGEVAALMADAGMIVIAAFISPFQADRARAREAAAPQDFHEIFVRAELSTCEKRDPKGLYRKARNGEIADFTGISSPYEMPEAPELVLDTDNDDVTACVDRLVRYIEDHVAIARKKDRKSRVAVL